MRQETINIYTFDELSDEAKSTARNEYRKDQEIFWGDEWIKSLHEFCNMFDIELCHWEYGFYTGVKIYTNIEYLEYGIDYMFTSETIAEYGLNKDCPFTGYCGDEDLLQPLRNIKEPVQRVEVLQDCLNKWQDDFNADIEYQQSDNYIDEHMTTNDYEFYQDGSTYK